MNIPTANDASNQNSRGRGFFSLYTHAPARGVDDKGHEKARDDAGAGQRDNPAAVDPANHAPVEGAPVAVAETDTDNGARDALRGGDGEFCRGASG